MWKLIAAADKNWGIGMNNQLLVQIPADMKQFREKTTNQVIVMGRRTLEGFPGGRVLPGRQNVILSGNPAYQVKDGLVVHSIPELVKLLEPVKQEIYVIGGESIYRQLLPYCDRAYITRIDHSYACDAYFPNLDADEAWERTYTGEEQTYFNLEYAFHVYRRRG